MPTFERVAEDVRVGDVVGVVGFPAKTKIGVLSIIPHAVPPLSAHASPMPGFSHTHTRLLRLDRAGLAWPTAGVESQLCSIHSPNTDDNGSNNDNICTNDDVPSQVSLLTPCLQMLPKEHYAPSDVDTRFR